MSESITIISTSVASSAALIWITRTWISARLKSSIQHEYDQKLEALKAELKFSYEAKAEVLKAEFQREAEKLRFATATSGEAQLVAHQRKLDALEKLWKGVLGVTNGCPGILKMLDVMTVDEHPQAVRNPNFSVLLKGVELKAMKDVLEKLIGDYEQVRPYVGEVLWTQFHVYQTVVLRACMLASQWETDIAKLDWASDKMNQTLIYAAVGAEDSAAFSRLRYGRLGWLQQKITERILSGIKKVISGEAIGADAVRQTEHLEELIREANAESRKIRP